MKFSAIILILYILTDSSNQIEAVSFITDYITNPLGSITETLFKWNPFKGDIDPLKMFISNFEEFDLDATSVKRNYNYGCTCRNLNCSCCAHIEATIINLSKTGNF